MKNFSGVCQAAGADKPLRAFFICITNIVVPLLVVISGCSDQLNTKVEKKEPVSMEVNSGEYPSSGFLNLSWEDTQILAKSV